MTKARFKRPMDPAEIAERRRIEREEAGYFAQRADADPSVVVRIDHRGAVIHAKRSGVFGLLLSRRGITQDQFDSVNRLYDDLAIARHEADQGLPTAGGDGSSLYGPLDRALAAQHRCGVVQEHMAQRLWIVLRDLIANEIGGAPEPWRNIVRMATAEENEECQAMAVRWACAELVTAYRTIDNAEPVHRPRAKLAGGV